MSVDDKYLLGILNSSLNFYLFRWILPKLRGDFYEPSYVFFKDFPIKKINSSDSHGIKYRDNIISLVEKMLDLHQRISSSNTPHEHDLIKRQLDATDKEIDSLVYELYGLTEEEIRIVEEGV